MSSKYKRTSLINQLFSLEEELRKQWCQLVFFSQGPPNRDYCAVLELSPLFSQLSSDLWTNISVAEPGPLSPLMKWRWEACVWVRARLCTQYRSTSCWNGVTSIHWDQIYYFTAICICVCAYVCGPCMHTSVSLNAVCLSIPETYSATWQQPAAILSSSSRRYTYKQTHKQYFLAGTQ